MSAFLLAVVVALTAGYYVWNSMRVNKERQEKLEAEVKKLEASIQALEIFIKTTLVNTNSKDKKKPSLSQDKKKTSQETQKNKKESKDPSNKSPEKPQERSLKKSDPKERKKLSLPEFNHLKKVRKIADMILDRDSSDHETKLEECENLLPDDISSQFLPLTERDWRFILTDSLKFTLEEGQVLIEQNNLSKEFYLHYEGTLKIHRNYANGKQIEDQITKLGFYGEISLLSGSQTSPFSVIAQSKCGFYKIRLELLKELLLAKPTFAKRFYTSFCKLSADKLTFINYLRKGKQLSQNFYEVIYAKPDSDNSVASLKNKKEVKYFNKFHLPECETLIDAFPCVEGRTAGIMYISAHFLCFYSKFLSLACKIIVKTPNIVAVTELPKSNKFFRFSIIYIENDSSEVTKQLKFGFESEQSLQKAYNLLEEFRKISKGSEPLLTDTLLDTNLSSNDFEKILNNPHTSMIRFKSGQNIVEENKPIDKIYQVISGSCTVKKFVEGKERAIGQIGVNEIFGEISLLLKGPASSTITVNENTTVYGIDHSFIEEELWESDPQLVLRFYHYVCRVLYMRYEKALCNVYK